MNVVTFFLLANSLLHQSVHCAIQFMTMTRQREKTRASKNRG